MAVLVTMLVTSSSPASATPLTFTSISADDAHACGITAAGAAYCWGKGSYGRLGNGSTSDSSVPVAVSGGHTFASITTGGGTTCGLTQAGAAYCWGKGNTGALGDGLNVTSHTPVLVSGGYTWISISAGTETTCAIRNNGAAYCWGWGVYGQLGDGGQSDSGTPSLVSGGYSWTSISTSMQGTCGIRNNGAAYCWGLNTYGDVGDGSTTQRLSPTLVSGGYTWSSISKGYDHTCGIVASTNAAYCWGRNASGEVGDASNTDRNAPVAVDGGWNWTAISAGEAATCGIRNNGSSYCWGWDDYGQLGDNPATSDSNVPALVAGGHSFTSIEAGYEMACALSTIGVAYCWGHNDFRQLGNGSTEDQYVPVVVFIDQKDNTVDAIVDPSLTFTVSAHSGTCNGVAQTGSASPTAVALGRINAANGIAAQDLIVSTNANNGFSVFARYAAQMQDGAAHTIANVSGTNASPGAFPASGTEAFGYTTSDATLGNGTPDRFTSGGAKWAALSTTNAEVSFASTIAAADTVCVAYQAGAAPTTRAGAYSTTVIYTAVPAF